MTKEQCKYCHITKNDEGPSFDDELGDIWLARDTDGSWLCGRTYHWGEVFYCPRCGRKLGDDE